VVRFVPLALAAVSCCHSQSHLPATMGLSGIQLLGERGNFRLIKTKGSIRRTNEKGIWGLVIIVLLRIDHLINQSVYKDKQ